MIPTKFRWNLIISFEEEDQNKHFPGSPLPQHITPNRAPMGPPTKMPWTTFILHLERYLHTTCMYILGPSYFWISWRRCLKFTQLPLVPRGGGVVGARSSIFSNYGSLPLRMIPTKFSWNLIISFEEEDQNKHFPGSPLPQHITPNRAPMGPPTKMPWTTFILHLERYLHTTCMYLPGPSYFWILRRRCLKFT